MDISQSLSIESFSYSWLVNLKPSLDNSPEGSFRASLDASDEASFIEMDPKLSPSKRFFIVHQDFNNFDFPTLQAPLSIVHADELISNGFLVPVFVQPLKMEEYDDSFESLPSTPESSRTQENVHLFRRIRCSSLRRYQRLSKRLLQKYLELVRPICQKLRGGRKSRPRGGLNNWDCSATTSPRSSAAYSLDNCRKSFDSESSIYEAVLHCKRTIGHK